MISNFFNRSSVLVYGPLLFCLSISYLNFFYIKYTEEPATKFPPPDYEVRYSLCKQACLVIDSKFCAEWSSIEPGTNLCEYVCDSYLDNDSINYSAQWNSRFSCATRAESAEDLIVCDISCTVMEKM